MAPLIPDDDEPVKGNNVSLPESMWKTLDEIAETETRSRQERKVKGQVSRNKVIRHFLEWAIEDYRRQKAAQEARERDEKAAADAHGVKSREKRK